MLRNKMRTMKGLKILIADTDYLHSSHYISYTTLVCDCNLALSLNLIMLKLLREVSTAGPRI